MRCNQSAAASALFSSDRPGGPMMLVRATCFLLAISGIWRAAAQDDVVIRTTTSLVEVRVVAEDKHGKPIADLKKSDFQILDNGRPQPIRLFAAYRGPAGLTAPKAVGNDQSDGSSPTPSDYALILLDWLNTSHGNRIFVQEKVLQLLKNYQPRQRLAVFVLSRNNPRLLSDFTYDRDLLTYMVSRLSLDPEDNLGPSHDESPFAGRGRGAQTPQADLAHEAALDKASRQTVDTSVALEKIADHMLHVPGRKALLWVTTGIPMVVGGSYYAAFIESALGRLNKADTAIYTIDARGLAFTPPSDSLYEFARRTGGEIFYNRNDLDNCMRTALEDMAVSYTLGFHMSGDAKPGLHELQVRLKRPGVNLRYRESYDPAAAIR
jgi:VWFA-related protein